MKYTPIIATLIVMAGLATAFQVHAKETKPRYNLNFAFGKETSVSIEVSATDIFHVVTRQGKESYDISGTTIPQHGKVVVRIVTCKQIHTPVLGPNNMTADSTHGMSIDSVVFLRPGGEPVPMGGLNGESFTVTLSPAKAQ